jgi:hypothetical protein
MFSVCVARVRKVAGEASSCVKTVAAKYLSNFFRADGKASSHRGVKWVTFQLFSALITVVVLCAVLPSFFRWLRPQRDIEQSVRYCNSTKTSSWSTCTELEQEKLLRSLPNKTTSAPEDKEKLAVRRSP